MYKSTSYKGEFKMKIEIMAMIQRVSHGQGRKYRIYVGPGDYWVVRANSAKDAIRLFESFSVYKITECWMIPARKDER